MDKVDQKIVISNSMRKDPTTLYTHTRVRCSKCFDIIRYAKKTDDNRRDYIAEICNHCLEHNEG
jgi:hypothetical protein